ncbi:malectin domain-containing carbohydrate-binding protein [Pontibacter sp. H249]|uniref:malectin domain-containing carbohydrate-binding protein n=1 Tax=Pontibacter sp. H249 TaxID=3133420 RepID=UPI0030C271D2
MDEPGSTGPGPNDPKVNNLDNLHYIGNINSYISGSHYGGHPTPVRANPAGAGLYTHNGTTGVWRTSKTGANPLPANWPPMPLSMANPIEGDFQNPGETDLAILTFPNSTNGLTEYTASNFNGALQGALLAADYGGKILKISLTEDGSDVTNSKKSGTMQNNDLPFASGFGSQPLDVTAQGDNDIFPGSVWAATYGSNVITIFEPADFVACSGIYSTTLDDDNDGYSNADEIDNGTNPCSASSLPTDFNQNFLSDINNPDDDSDSINDNVDLFGLDAQNGLSTNLPVNYELFNNYPGTGFFGLGFTGLMTNKQPDNDYLNLFDESNLIAGGAVGAFSVVAVSGGDALGALNSQENAFQYGINVNASTGPFTVEASMLGPFFNGNLPQNDQSQGIYIGTGDQDNYLKIVMNAHNGSVGIEVVYEEAGQPAAYQHTLEGGLPSSFIEFYLSIDPATGTVQPKYSRDGGAITAIGSPIQVGGALLNAIQSTPALAVGIIATSRNASHFTATWDKINITTDPVVSTGAWQIIEPAAGAPTARHENGFVEAGDKFYLLGGRGIKPVQAYDPIAKIWTDKAVTPIELHHFQAVTMNGLIYIIGAFPGSYPNEVPVSKVYIYNPVTDKWFNGPSIPEDRHRGSAGVVVYKDKIYLVSGITHGHSSGHVTWFDEYDPVTNTWTKLPDAPRARDHFNAVIINGKLYVAGGRRSSHATGETYSLTVLEVDVFDFETNAWMTLPSTSNLPTQRAGTATVVLGDELVVIGGESMSQTIAHKHTEALNVKTNTWRQIADLQVGRHATQAIVNNKGIYIAAGNGSRGGGVELSSQEAFYLFGPTTPVSIALNESRLTAPADINFRTVAAGTTKSNTITVTNEGGSQAIVVHAISVSGASTFSYTSSYTLPVVIPAGGNFSITLNYSPIAIKSESGQLLISHSGQTGNTAVTLSGGPNTITASPTSLHFFSQQAGTTSDPQQVSITNNSAVTVEITSVALIGVNSSEFGHDFTGSVNLEAGASASIGITFTPALLGTKAAQLKVIYAGTEELVIGLTGEGIDNKGGATALYRINSGGKEYLASGGLFSADAHFAPAPGYVYSKKKEDITGTGDDELYRFERSSTSDNGSFSYALPVAGGRYRVVLHFAELYWTEAGRRVFDVRAEGALVLDDYDVFARAGGRYAAVAESFEVEVGDGALDLLFSALAGKGGANRPKVSAIEVYSQSQGTISSVPDVMSDPEPSLPEELAAEETTLMVYPNPFDKVLNIYIESEEVQEYDVTVYDVMGHELYRGIHCTETAEAGVLAIDLANQNVQSGKLYLVSVVSRTTDFRKVVKVLRD